MKRHSRKIILLLSLMITVLLIVVSLVGLFTPDFYLRETANWQAQSLGQDRVDLLIITPVLLISSLLMYIGNKAAGSVLAGTMIYLIYTFIIYCFALHFNPLFFIYCSILGLSFYSLLLFIYEQIHYPVRSKYTLWHKITGIYFMVIAMLFYGLWLSEIVPASLANTVPKALAEAGLFTNPVHVLDLAIVLPGIFITGIMLLQKQSLGSFLAPMVLTFFILMDLTIGTLIVYMKQNGLDASLPIAIVMGILALLSSFLLVKYLSAKE